MARTRPRTRRSSLGQDESGSTTTQDEAGNQPAQLDHIVAYNHTEQKSDRVPASSSSDFGRQ
eukprot:2860104-Pyramimonas_sp.AAC.1